MPLSGTQIEKITYVKDVITREMTRQQKALNRIRLLKDDYKELAREKLKDYVSDETWKKLKKFINTTINVYKTVISEISVIYNENPQRIFTTSDESKEAETHVEIVEGIYKRIKINQKMKKVNRYVNALNDLILQVLFRKGNIAIDILTPNVSSIVQDEEDLTLPEVVSIRKEYIDSIGDRGEKTKHVIWTDSEHYSFDHNFIKESINEEDKNPYGIMPFVFLHREIPDSNFWDETSGEDLYECTLIVACLQTLIDSYFVWNSFKQLAVKAEKLPEGLAHTPDKVIHLEGPDDQAIILDFTIALKELLESLRTYITSVVQNYGVDWNSLVLKLKEVSGKALKIKSSKLQRLWNNQLEIFRDAEEEIFELIKRIYEVEEGTKLKVEMKIKFPAMENYKDEKEELEILEKEVGLNLVDIVEVFMDRNKGYKNYEDAKGKILKIIESNNEIKALIEEPIDKLLGE